MEQNSGTGAAAGGGTGQAESGGLGPKAWDSLYILKGPDLDLLQKLGVEPPARLEHAKEALLGEFRIPAGGHEHTAAGAAVVRVYLQAMPAKFWRFAITTVEGNQFTLHSGSGRLSDYWPSVKLIALGMIVCDPRVEPASDDGLIRCVFCGGGNIRRDDPNWAKLAGEHVATCEKHPLHTSLKMLKSLREACERAQCDCSVSERDSGHKVGCWMPDLSAALAGGAA